MLYRVFTELTHFSGRKNYLTKLKIKYIKFQNYAFIKIKKYFMKIQIQYEQKDFTILYKYATLAI